MRPLGSRRTRRRSDRGNLVRDIVGGTPPRAGGAVFYQARVFAEIEHAIDVRLVTRCAPQDRELLLEPLEEFGLPITWRPARETQTFSFHYDGDHRVMEIVSLGDTWTPDDTRPTHDAEHHGRRELRVCLVGPDPDIRPVDQLQPEVEQLAEPGLALVLDDHVPADLQREIVWRHLTREVSAVYRGRGGWIASSTCCLSSRYRSP